MTAYFRMIEPRAGRVFSELKIKHLGQFPIPGPEEQDAVILLNGLGRRRSETEEQLDAATLPADADRLKREADQLDRRIDEVSAKMLAVTAEDADCLNSLVEP